MENIVNIIIKEDIITVSNYIYKAKSVYENVPKFMDHIGRICYVPVEGHVIIGDENVIELGFITSETFRQIKMLKDMGELSPEELTQLLEKIQAMETNVTNLSEENNELKKEIELLKYKCDKLSKFGLF